MHFFGTFGTLSFLTGFVSVLWMIWKKIEAIHFLKGAEYREVVDQPLFFIALVAIIIGMQLFLAGFIGEMMATNFNSKKDYIFEDTIGIDQ